MTKLQKAFFPWTAACEFASEAEFQTQLKKTHRLYHSLRAVFLAAAAVLLLAGTFLDRYSITVLTVIPLVPVLALTPALSRIETVWNGQNISQPETKE